MGRKKTDAPLDEIESALLKRALGFTLEESTSEDIVDKRTGESMETAKRRVTKKSVPPDVRALLFWLKNRRPERWRDRIEVPAEREDYGFDEDEMKL